MNCMNASIREAMIIMVSSSNLWQVSLTVSNAHATILVAWSVVSDFNREVCCLGVKWTCSLCNLHYEINPNSHQMLNESNSRISRPWTNEGWPRWAHLVFKVREPGCLHERDKIQLLSTRSNIFHSCVTWIADVQESGKHLDVLECRLPVSFYKRPGINSEVSLALSQDLMLILSMISLLWIIFWVRLWKFQSCNIKQASILGMLQSIGGSCLVSSTLNSYTIARRK